MFLVQKIFDLDDKAEELAKNLPYGKQRRLEIARALAAKPKLLLLDEPSIGLVPIVVEEIFEIIKEIRKSGTTILLVEQNANAVLQIADSGYVVETGRVVIEGLAKDLLHDDAVRKAYLGE